MDPARLPWTEEFSSCYPQLREELHQFLKREQLETYFNSPMVSVKDSWKTISLKTWGIWHFKNKKKFPVLNALSAKHRQILSVSFSQLEPHARILPHCGDTNAILRCHMGIDIPSPLPECGLKVKETSKAWENGKWIVFMDAYHHEAWNNTDKSRFVLIIDVLRDEFKRKKWAVCSTVLTSLFLQRRAEKYHFDLFKRPFMIKSIARVLQPFSLVKIGLLNFFRIY